VAAPGTGPLLVGLTYDLRSDYLALGYGEDETAEFDRPDTIEAIEGALQSLGHRTVRIGHVRQLTARLAAGDRWDLVFNIAEGLRGYGREAQVPALLEAWEIPFTFSDTLVLSLTLHKGFTKHVLRDLGIATPPFRVLDDPAQAASVDLPYPLFAKPVAEGTGKGISATSRVESPQHLREVCRDLLARYRQPVLVETYLPGREFTVGIIGTDSRARAVGTAEIILRGEAERHAYSYVNKERCEDLVIYRLCDDQDARRSAELALAAWRGLDCRDAGRVDVRLDGDGHPHILEINPLAGLHPEHSDLPIICTQAGLAYRDLIEEILEEARLRCHPPGTTPAHGRTTHG
jgi:D-alanine-D-alanine ligase